MSVIRAILFYSKYDKKSMQMRRTVEDTGVDLETISVDSSKIRKLLLQDEEFGITEVPTVLVLLDNGDFKTYIRKALDNWFGELLTNIQTYQQQFEPPSEVQQIEEPQPATEDTPLNYDVIAQDSEYTNTPQPVNEAQASMIRDSIIQDSAPPQDDPNIQQGRKEVKQDNISPMELAKKMMENREAYDEQVEEKRPFT